jgi:hypothetical protein
MKALGKVAAGAGWRGVGAVAVCVSALAAATLPAQQATPQPAPLSAQRTIADSQQPGAGAQVHTGTASGIDADTRLQNLLADHQFARLAAMLDQLPPEQAQLYRGILANRSNDLKTSIQLLEPLVEKVVASGNASHEKLLRKALAEDYLRIGDWDKAAKAYGALESRLKDRLSSDEQDEIELPVKLLPLAQANPPMTVEPCDRFALQVSKNPLGLIDIPIFVDARPHSWMLDPTAPFNLMARSLAKEVGLRVSEQAATIRTLTGKPMQVRMAIVPRFTIGGRLTLRNMTVFIYEDADYYFPRTGYQVKGVLGYPALSALGSLTVTADDTIEVQPAKQPSEALAAAAKAPLAGPGTGTAAPERSLPNGKASQAPQGVPFFLDGDQVIVALGKAGDERMYVMDAGSQQTYLTSRYFDEHAGGFSGQKMSLFTIPGSQSFPPQPAYMAETVNLPVGAQTVQVHYVQVLTQPLGSAAIDDVYGVLGIDALDQLKAYTFDYRTMRFSVKPD